MDISALVHRHAEAVVFTARRIRHIHLLCFVLMFSRQGEEKGLREGEEFGGGRVGAETPTTP
jgi:hypothetical protein